MTSAANRSPNAGSAAEPDRSDAVLVGAEEGFAWFVPSSSLQFLDFTLDDVDAARIRRRFFEDAGDGEEGDGPALHAVALNDDVVHHPFTGEAIDASDTYAVDGAQAIAPFLDCWFPLPYLRQDGEDENANPMLGEGPTNWVRAYIARAPQGDGRKAGYTIVIAVDTAIDAKAPALSRTYAAPTPEDVRQDRVFRFSDDENDIAQFVSEAWVDDWLSSLYREHRRREALDAGEEDWDESFGLEHLAHYLTLLSVLKRGCAPPPLRFLNLGANAQQWNAVPVDLVLDIGTSRTCALIRERTSATGVSEKAKPAMLPLRDLSQPRRRHSGVFSSRLQFARAAFGNEAWSRWSGRANAFFWPSLARIGNEAERLSAEEPSGEDWTGLSSPMHYLWDDQPSPVAWRFARQGAEAGRGALISGMHLAHITETGEVLEAGEKRSAATKPRFSRSSLATFFAVEVVAQALAAINAPSATADGRPRILDRILLTVPPNISAYEQSILKKRIDGAVQLVWQSSGWTEPGTPFVPRFPEVRFVCDNATNAGLAYVHNELGFKFAGKAREYLDLMGKLRPEHKNGRSLRVASLDIGGAATCLSVATYELTETGTLVQAMQIADGCRIGGDDILKAIVERHLMPALERRLLECKLPNARRFLERVITGERKVKAKWSGEYGRRFAGEIARPLAISMLETHLGSRLQDGEAPIERSLASLLSLHAPEAKAVLDELDELASDEGAENFSPHDTLISFKDRDIAFTIRSVLDPIVANVARIVQALDCDVLVVSGWVSRLPSVIDMLIERMPSQPGRIVPLAGYRMADWYILRERSGAIGDPKSVAAMGAVLASGGTVAGGLPLTQRPLDPEASRLHVGRMSERGLVANDTIMFVLGDPSSAKDLGGKEGRTCTLSVETPVLIGGRRIGLENWPATPLYWLDYEAADQKTRSRGPLKVTIERVPGERGLPEMLRIVRACDSDGNNLATADVTLRLQTMRSPKGHWLDTGAIAIE